MICIAASTLFAFRSLIFASAISRTCAHGARDLAGLDRRLGPVRLPTGFSLAAFFR